MGSRCDRSGLQSLVGVLSSSEVHAPLLMRKSTIEPNAEPLMSMAVNGPLGSADATVGVCFSKTSVVYRELVCSRLDPGRLDRGLVLHPVGVAEQHDHLTARHPWTAAVGARRRAGCA